MRTIIILAILIVVVVWVFLYFFLLEDENKLKNIFKKSNNLKINHEENLIDTTLFQKWLSELTINNEELNAIKIELQKKIIWMEDFINLIIINLLCGWHVLVQWVPGLAKTKTIHTFAQILGLDFKRIQFTPDMLPADIVGVEVYNSKTKEFETKLGPIIANIILADEINRSTPKVQSALLEAMQEKQVTIGGKTFKIPEPFFVLATQNPLEHEWTYNLPEAQIDRFLFKILVDYPDMKDEKKILDAMEHDDVKVNEVISHKQLEYLIKWIENIKISDNVKHYITRLIKKTREKNQNILYGASPRWSIGLMTAAKAVAFVEWREYVTHEDIQKITLAVLRHRIVLSYDAKIQGLDEDQVLLDLFSHVKFV